MSKNTMRKFLEADGMAAVEVHCDNENWVTFRLSDGGDSAEFYGTAKNVLKQLKKVEDAIQFLRDNSE